MKHTMRTMAVVLTLGILSAIGSQSQAGGGSGGICYGNRSSGRGAAASGSRSQGGVGIYYGYYAPTAAYYPDWYPAHHYPGYAYPSYALYNHWLYAPPGGQPYYTYQPDRPYCR